MSKLINIQAPWVKSKFFSYNKDMATQGPLSHVGIGFRPRVLIAFSCLDGGVGSISFGYSDGNKDSRCIHLAETTLIADTVSVLIKGDRAAGGSNSCVVTSYDADGFTLTWTKVGLPVGTLYTTILCLG